MEKLSDNVSDMSISVTRRPKWKNSWDYMFASAGLIIGLGNFWRFPYLCFKYGGGAFLLPYLLFAFFLAVPLIALESSIGQSTRRGLTSSWGIVPLFQGIAYAQAVLMINSNVSYSIILVWTLKYLVNSFSAEMPWSVCHNAWNTPSCVAAGGTNITLSNFSIHNINASSGLQSNESMSAGLEYWNYEVLGISSGVEELGSLRIDLVLYLFIIWFGVYLSTFKGIKWTAKVVYVTATLPVVLIVIILIRAAMLEGAAEGIRYYLIPDLKKLADPTVWINAGSQVLYSYGTVFGCHGTLSGFNHYHNNFLRDSMVMALLCMAASLLSGFAVSVVLGFIASYLNVSIDQVAQSGPGLAFVVYPEALSLLPIPQLWCALFFVILLFLGFDSQFVYLECFTTFLMDTFPQMQKYRFHREILQAVLCISMFLSGLMMVTEGGVYVFEIYNNYAIAGWCLFFIAGCEFVAFAWVCGFDRYWEEIRRMIGDTPAKRYLKVSWKYIGPVACVSATIYYLSGQALLTYNSYIYPTWAQVVAHMLSFSSVIMIPGYAIYKIAVTLKSGGTLSQLCYNSPVREFDNKRSCSEFGDIELVNRNC